MSAQRAMNMCKVQALQAKLSHAAKQSLDRKFGALYDKIYREDVLRMAWKRVRENKGAPGIDRLSIEQIEDEIGVEKFLQEIQEELQKRRYRPDVVRRCWIDKPGKPEKRPLGILVIKDRVVQTATKLVIEPIFEANFMSCSYGYRPGRSANDAVEAIRFAIGVKDQTTVMDADIMGYFDNIRQDILLNLVKRRISDPRVLKLIRGWLEAGVMDKGEYTEPDGLVTPQGAVISPLLSNIYLHAFDKMFQKSRIPATLVRFCDDFVILIKGYGKWLIEKVQQMLDRLGLKLHMGKTRVMDASKGFDFLGIHFRLCRTHRKDAKRKWYCAIWPSNRSMLRIKQKIRDVIGRRYDLSAKELIAELNPVIRGWNNYHTRSWPEAKRFRHLNWFIHDRIRIFLKRKHQDQSRGRRRVRNNWVVRLGLCKFGWSGCFNDNGY